jgi:hypothetical protein
LSTMYAAEAKSRSDNNIDVTKALFVDGDAWNNDGSHLSVMIRIFTTLSGLSISPALFLHIHILPQKLLQGYY